VQIHLTVKGQSSSRGKIKGLVHPKMKILSAFTHPQVLYEIIFSHNTKEDTKNAATMERTD